MSESKPVSEREYLPTNKDTLLAIPGFLTIVGIVLIYRMRGKKIFSSSEFTLPTGN